MYHTFPFRNFPIFLNFPVRKLPLRSSNPTSKYLIEHKFWTCTSSFRSVQVNITSSYCIFVASDYKPLIYLNFYSPVTGLGMAHFREWLKLPISSIHRRCNMIHECCILFVTRHHLTHMIASVTKNANKETIEHTVTYHHDSLSENMPARLL